MSFPLYQTVSRGDNNLFQKSKLSEGNSVLLTELSEKVICFNLTSIS